MVVEEVDDVLRRLLIRSRLGLLSQLLLLDRLLLDGDVEELLCLKVGLTVLIERAATGYWDVRGRRSEVVEEEVDVGEDLVAPRPEARNLGSADGSVIDGECGGEG